MLTWCMIGKVVKDFPSGLMYSYTYAIKIRILMLSIPLDTAGSDLPSQPALFLSTVN